jgi:HSP20 family protein
MQDDIERAMRGDQVGRPGNEDAAAYGNWTPAVDVYERQDCYVIRADLPGVELDQVELTLENGVLDIKGKRAPDEDDAKEGYRRLERPKGAFFRRFNLPDRADESGVKAILRNGVLEVTVPKRREGQPHRIEVRG